MQKKHVKRSKGLNIMDPTSGTKLLEFLNIEIGNIEDLTGQDGTMMISNEDIPEKEELSVGSKRRKQIGHCIKETRISRTEQRRTLAVTRAPAHSRMRNNKKPEHQDDIPYGNCQGGSYNACSLQISWVDGNGRALESF